LPEEFVRTSQNAQNANFRFTEFSEVAQKTQRAGEERFRSNSSYDGRSRVSRIAFRGSEGVVLRTVPEYLAGVTQIESLEAVIRDAVRHGEANPIWSIHALTQELAQIARAHERAEIFIGAHGSGGFIGAGYAPILTATQESPVSIA
jgi:hypothetical protein